MREYETEGYRKKQREWKDERMCVKEKHRVMKR